MLRHWPPSEDDGAQRIRLVQGPPSLPALKLSELAKEPFDLLASKDTARRLPLAATYTGTSTPSLRSDNSSLESIRDTPSPPPTHLSNASNEKYNENEDLWTRAHADTIIARRHQSWDQHENEVAFLTHNADAIAAVYHARYPETWIISHQRLLKDVRSLLMGTPSLCFVWCDDQQAFRARRAKMRLAHVHSDALDKLLAPMLTFGSQMRRLLAIANDTRTQHIHGAIWVAFACSLLDLLHYIQHTLATRLRSSLPLLAIHHRIRPFATLLHHLMAITDENATSGAQLITLLYDRVVAMDALGGLQPHAFVQTTLVALLSDTVAPWLEMLQKALATGHWNDTYGDFFVTTSIDDDGALQDDRLPRFLDIDTAHLVRRAIITLRRRQYRSSDMPSSLVLTLLPENSSELPESEKATPSPPSLTPSSSSSTSISCTTAETPIVLDPVACLPGKSTKSCESVPLNPLAPSLTPLPELDAHLRQHQRLVTTLMRYTQARAPYPEPISAVIAHHLIQRVSSHCQAILTQPTSSSPPTIPTADNAIHAPDAPLPGRHDLVFTFWDGHDRTHPPQWDVDAQCQPVYCHRARDPPPLLHKMK